MSINNFGTNKESYRIKSSDQFSKNEIHETPKKTVNDDLSSDPIVETQYSDFTALSNPCVDCYLQNTTKIDFSNVKTFTRLDSISDGTMTIDFDPHPLSKRQVPHGGWFSDWPIPPYGESYDPPAVLFTHYSTSLTLKLSKGVKVFGFEMQPDYYNLPSVAVVEFYGDGGTTLIGTVSRNLINNFPLYTNTDCLIAVESGTHLIDKVVITLLSSMDENFFAIANLRYGDCIDTDLICTTRDIPFSYTIDLNFPILDSPNFDVKFLGFSASITNCEVSTCLQEVRVILCDTELTGYIPVDIVTIDGNAKLLFQVSNVNLNIDSETSDFASASFICTPHILFHQTCFAYGGSGRCYFNQNELLAYLGDAAYTISPDQMSITISGNVVFVPPTFY